jgi:N-acetylglucosamine-6-phosphate deacetylase
MVHPERLVNVIVDGATISEVHPVDKGTSYDFGGPDDYLCSGFFDPQVNGYGGVDFNGMNLNPERLHQAAIALASSGVTRFLPTLITASRERTIRQLKILAQAIERDPVFERMCLGLHLEGPYISPEDGPRGAHSREFVRLPNWDEVEQFQEACGDRIRLMTLAPEIDGAIPFVEQCVKKGIVVGIGHTNAAAEILEDALRAGARISCHLGNGAHAVLPRHQNPIQKQLSMDGLMASIIVDGIHLPDYVVKNFVRAKGVDRVLLTTDSMAGAAAPAGRYTLGDLEVEVREDDRSARLPGTPYLAGSALTMNQAINHVIRFAEVDLASAVQMAVQNGAKLFPDLGSQIVPGAPANLLLFEYVGKKVVIHSTWVHGEEMSETWEGVRCKGG